MKKREKLKLIKKLSAAANVSIRAGRIEDGLRKLRAIHLIATHNQNFEHINFSTFDI